MQRAHAVLDGEHDGGLVLACSARRFLCHHEEPGDIMRIVLDLSGNDLQAVEHGSHFAGNGARFGIVLGHLRGPGSARRVEYGNTRRILLDPLPALARHLRMGEYLPDVLQLSRTAHQVLRNFKHDLCIDLQVRVDEHVERVVHHALGGVLDGNDAVIGAAAVHFAEDVTDGLDRHILGRKAELLHAGHVRERCAGAQVGNLEGPLQGQG